MPNGARVPVRFVAVVSTCSPAAVSRNSISSANRHWYAGCGSSTQRIRTTSDGVRDGCPRQPADETVDRVRPLGFVERHPFGLALERVPPVAQAVRPGCEHLPTTARGHLVDREAVDQRIAGQRVVPEGRADLGDDGVLVATADLELTTRRWQALRLRHWTTPVREMVRPNGRPDGR